MSISLSLQDVIGDFSEKLPQFINSNDIASLIIKISDLASKAKEDTLADSPWQQASLLAPIIPTILGSNIDVGSGLISSTAVPVLPEHVCNKAYTDAFAKDFNVVTVRKSGGDFSSVYDAVSSITTASDTNPFIVSVGLGTWVEPQIDVPSYVYLIGESMEGCIITPDLDSHPVFVMSQYSGLSFLSVTGSGVGQAAILCENVDDYVLFHKIDVFSVDVGLKIWGHGASPASKVYMEYFSVEDYATAGVQVFSNDGVEVLVENENFYSEILAGNGLTAIDVAGANADVVIHASLLKGDPSLGSNVGISVSNGAEIVVAATTFHTFTTGLVVPNIGAPPTIISNAILFDDCTNDIAVDHPLTTGSLSGAYTPSKVAIASDLMSIFSSDPADGVTFTGQFIFGETYNTRTLVTPLILHGPGVGLMSGGDLSDGGGFVVDVATGTGYTSVGSATVYKFWGDTTITLSANVARYIYVNNSGILSSGASFPDTTSNILLGRVVTNGTGIELIDKAPFNAHHASNLQDNMVRNAIGALFKSGCLVTENVTPKHLNVGSGIYYFSDNIFSPSGETDITFHTFFRALPSGWVIGSTNVVDTSNYDNGSGALVAIPGGEFARHTLYVSGDGVNKKYLFVYAQTTYASLVLAEKGSIPVPPSYFTDGVVLIASIIVNQGAASIVAGGGEILDNRPILGFVAPTSTASLIHGNLLLLAADDHPQYLLTTGARALTGDLSLGGNNIINVNNVDGVDVSSHQARHLPNGFDPITTAIAVGLSSSSVNAEGIQNSLARSDHTHAITFPTPALGNQEVSATNLITTSSLTDVLMTGMTITPAAGTYFCMFNGNIGWPAGGGSETVVVSLYVGGVQKTFTQRSFNWNGSAFMYPLVCNAIVTVNGSQAIEIRWHMTGAGSSNPRAVERVLDVIRIA